MEPVISVIGVGQHLHQHITVCNKADDNTYILGKRNQQLAEILIGNGIMLGVKLLDAAHALNKSRRILTEFIAELLRSNKPLLHHRVKQSRKQRSLLKSRLLHNHDTGPDTPFQSRNTMSISSISTFGNTLAEQTLKPAPILRLKQRPGHPHQFPV